MIKKLSIWTNQRKTVPVLKKMDQVTEFHFLGSPSIVAKYQVNTHAQESYNIPKYLEISKINQQLMARYHTYLSLHPLRQTGKTTTKFCFYSIVWYLIPCLLLGGVLLPWINILYNIFQHKLHINMKDSWISRKQSVYVILSGVDKVRVGQLSLQSTVLKKFGLHLKIIHMEVV